MESGEMIALGEDGSNIEDDMLQQNLPFDEEEDDDCKWNTFIQMLCICKIQIT